MPSPKHPKNKRPKPEVNVCCESAPGTSLVEVQIGYRCNAAQARRVLSALPRWADRAASRAGTSVVFDLGTEMVRPLLHIIRDDVVLTFTPANGP
jgi:hypothetical protein